MATTRLLILTARWLSTKHSHLTHFWIQGLPEACWWENWSYELDWQAKPALPHQWHPLLVQMPVRLLALLLVGHPGLAWVHCSGQPPVPASTGANCRLPGFLAQ